MAKCHVIASTSLLPPTVSMTRYHVIASTSLLPPYCIYKLSCYCQNLIIATLLYLWQVVMLLPVPHYCNPTVSMARYHYCQYLVIATLLNLWQVVVLLPVPHYCHPTVPMTRFHIITSTLLLPPYCIYDKVSCYYQYLIIATLPYLWHGMTLLPVWYLALES